MQYNSDWNFPTWIAFIILRLKIVLDAIIQERIVFTLSVNMVDYEVKQKFQKYQSDLSVDAAPWEQTDIKSRTFSTSKTLFTRWKLGALS